MPFAVSPKEFVSGNSLLSTSVGYVTMGTRYTAIGLIQLSQ